MKNDISPSMSWKGFCFKTLLIRNKDTIKLLVAFLMGYSYFVGFEWQPFLIGIGGLVGKLVQDSLDFYLTEVEL